VCPEQIVSSITVPEAPALIDQWGRIHHVACNTRVGRGIGISSLSIFHGVISRRHAEIVQTPSGWSVRDLDSANGTSINGQRISTANPLAPGDQLSVGGIGFYFCDDATTLRRSRESRDVRTVNALDLSGVVDLADEVTSQHQFSPTASDDVPIRLFEPAGGGGGVVELNDHQAQLGEAQFALLNVLLTRLTNEYDKPEVIRGYIRSSELLQMLPWDTPHPSDNHLKQLVRRTRRSLTSAGIPSIIESRQRFGYRLRISDEG